MAIRQKTFSILFLAILPLISCQKQTDSPNKISPTASKTSKLSALRGIASEGELIEGINKKIVAIDSQYQIVPLINELITLANKEENKENTSLQLYKLALKPVLKLEGIIWRFRKVVENSGALHLTALGLITKAYHRSYMYGPHIKATLDYLTTPANSYPMFENLTEAQDFLEKDIRPELQSSLSELQNLTKSLDDTWTLNFDGYLVSGFNPKNNMTFISEQKRYKTVIKPHLYYGISSLHRALGFIDYSVNYNISQLPQFVDKLVSKTAINNTILSKTFTRGLPQISTPKEASEILNGSKLLSNKKTFAPFLTLRKSTQIAKENLRSAMTHFKSASAYELKALEQTIILSDSDNGDRYIINPNFLIIGQESTVRRLNEMVGLYEKALKGETQLVTSHITGRQTKINLISLFTPYSDLKVFLPKESNFSSEKRGHTLKWKSGRNEFGWNYNYGKPVSYPDPTFGGFLPEANNENIYSIARDIKLTESLKVFSDYLPIP